MPPTPSKGKQGESKDPTKGVAEAKDPKDPKDAKNRKGPQDAKDATKGKPVKVEMSEEDVRKKEEMDVLTERAVQTSNPREQADALNEMKNEIRTATTSMTAVPKPIKFLRPHYTTLKEVYETNPASENAPLLADVLSLMAMTYSSTNDTRDCLRFRLLGTQEPVGTNGHEYVRNLSGEIATEFAQRMEKEQPMDDLLALVGEIVPFNILHNAEPDACDLLMEVDRMEDILAFVDVNNYRRISLYLLGCAKYIPEPDDRQLLLVVYDIFRKMEKYPDALLVAMNLGESDKIRETLDACENPSVKKQLAYMVGWMRTNVTLDDDQLNDIISNTNLNETYLSVARDMEVMEPKTPDDIYKSHLDSRPPPVDSAKKNLASTLVNAFVNAGFGNDKLMMEEGNRWLYKNKDHGMMSAAASLGMILLWDVDGGLTQLDKFFYSDNDYVKAGTLMAVGIVHAGVRNECDPAMALLTEYIDNKQVNLRTGAILGLGLAYAGQEREEILSLLAPVMVDADQPLESSAFAALSLGLVYCGSCNTEVAETIVEVLMVRGTDDTLIRFLCLGLGLLYIGRSDKAEATLEALKVLENKSLQRYCSLTVETCAYVGTGNVLKIQSLLHTCAEHLENDNAHQAVAVLGIALISMGEDIGGEMALRSLDHLLQYGEVNIRRAAALALGLLSVSNPRMQVMDTLSKLSHDGDVEVSCNAIFSLGLIGAGTNNARAAGMLRQLANYYYKEFNTQLFAVRVAQGILHMGKGLLTLSPYRFDRMLISEVSIAGLLIVMHAMFDIKNTILGKYHYLLYMLATSVSPRLFVAVDEEGNPVGVQARVGQAVDTAGQAGRPKTITGFQTHTTPVILGFDQRAELATEEYTPLSSVLEGFVIVQKNPDYDDK